MIYGIIFRGNHLHKDKNFKLKVVRIITNSRMRLSCRELFKKLEILLLYSQYIFSMSIFVIKNEHLFSTNNQIHIFQKRFKTNFIAPTAYLTKFQKAMHDTTIKIFNNLPHNIKELTNETESTVSECFKKFLLINFFYNIKIILIIRVIPLTTGFIILIYLYLKFFQHCVYYVK